MTDQAQREGEPVIAQSLLVIDHVGYAYRGGEEVVSVDMLQLSEHSKLLIIGPSGCGKTTLLHLIAGLLVPSRGRVAIDGQDLAALSVGQRDRFRGRNVGMVLQQFHLLASLSALQNLLVAQHVAGRRVDRAAAHQALDALDVADRADAFPHQLSVGQQQRVAIARAVVNRPKLLLADEPTSNLDDEACDAVTGLLLAVSERYGTSLVIATHDRRVMDKFPAQLQLPRRSTRRAA